MDDAEWTLVDAILFRPILMDGTKSKRFEQLMRRRLRVGTWQYRKMTLEEIGSDQDRLAW
jgi:hypothetical protein